MIEAKTAEEQIVLDLTGKQLADIAAVAEAAQPRNFGSARTEHTPGKTHGVKVVLPAKRAGGETHAATFHSRSQRQEAQVGADLLISAGRYLYLLPAAVDLMRRIQQETLHAARLAVTTSIGDGANGDAVAAVQRATEAIEQLMCDLPKDGRG